MRESTVQQSAEHHVAERELVASRIAQHEICIDIQSVREIRGWTPATPLPHAPSHVVGVINLRGTVLPVIDLARRLALGRTEPSARHVIVVVQIAGRICGLLVDAVSEILSITSDRVQPTPDVDSELARRFVEGVIADSGRLLNLIRLDHVVAEAVEQV